MSNEALAAAPQETAKIRYTIEVDYSLNDERVEYLIERISGVLHTPEVALRVFDDPNSIVSIDDYTVEITEVPEVAVGKMVKLEEYALRCALMQHLSEIPSEKSGQEILDMISTGESFDDLTVWSPFEMDEPEELILKIETMKGSLLEDFMAAHAILTED